MAKMNGEVRGIKFLELFLLPMLNFRCKNGKIPTIIQLTEVELTTGSIMYQKSTVWAVNRSGKFGFFF